MPAGSIVAFWAVALLLIMVPGADWAFVLGVSLRGRSVLPAVGGLVLGYTGITIVVAVGVGAVVGRSPALLGGLTVVGGCYLIWHGATTFARPRAAPVAGGAPQADTGRAVMVRGLGVSALNPKGLLIFLALLPQFTNPRWSGRSPRSSACSGWCSWRAAGRFTWASGPRRGRSWPPDPPPPEPSPGSPGPRWSSSVRYCSSGTDPRAAVASTSRTRSSTSASNSASHSAGASSQRIRALCPGSGASPSCPRRTRT